MTDNSTPAFPYKCEDGTEYLGMTLRDYFAGQALVGILSAIANEPMENPMGSFIAKDCYAIADRMLAARKA